MKELGQVAVMRGHIATLLKLKGEKSEFNGMLIDLKRIIKDDVEDFIEEVEKIQEEISALKVEHCNKNADGGAIISRTYDDKGNVTSESYVGLVAGEKPEFDARHKVLKEQLKTLDKKKIEPDFSEVRTVKRNRLPKDWSGEQEEIFYDFIEENKK